MAGNARITRGNIPRMLQYGIDKILDQMGKDYKGMGDRIFTEVKTDKGFFEYLQLAGMGIAGEKGEGEAITNFDSIDQDWSFKPTIRTVEKSARITMEMIDDNVYENLLPRIAENQMRALKHARDIAQANILNRYATAGYTYGDGSVLISTSGHTAQTGETISNRLAVDADMSEDAVEGLVKLIDNLLTNEGLSTEYMPKRIIVPSDLRFEVKRVLGGAERPATTDRDVNVLHVEGVIPEIAVWKRLTDADAFFIQTDAPDGLTLVRRKGIFTKSAQDFETYDTKVTAAERYLCTVGDAARCIVGTSGA